MGIDYKSIFRQAPIGIILLDADKSILGWNQWLVERTGFDEQFVLNKNLQDIYPDIKLIRFDLALENVIRNNSHQVMSHALNQFLIPIEVNYAGDHGLEWMPQQIYLAPIKYEDKKIAMVSIIDVTESVIRAKTLTKMAHRYESDSNHDQLTTAYNRRFLDQWLEHQKPFILRYNHYMSFLLFDIDHFKDINDTYGHNLGDNVLVDFCDLVSHELRDVDKLIRYGGEEFLVLLTHADHEVASSTAERIRSSVENTKFGKLNRGDITCSVGIATWTPDSGRFDIEMILKNADEALYYAKGHGRNCSYHIEDIND